MESVTPQEVRDAWAGARNWAMAAFRRGEEWARVMVESRLPRAADWKPDDPAAVVDAIQSVIFVSERGRLPTGQRVFRITGLRDAGDVVVEEGAL